MTTTANRPRLEVRFSVPGNAEAVHSFEHAFYIGRGEACQVLLNQNEISRQHLYCDFQHGQWWVHDLNSRSGTYVNGEPLRNAPINEPLQLQLGRDGLVLTLSLQTDPAAACSQPSTPLIRRANPAQLHRQTQLQPLSLASLKRATAIAARKQTLRYRSGFLLLLLLLGVATAVAVHHYANTRKLGGLAVDMFYAMKTLELQVVNLQSAVFDNFSELSGLYGGPIAVQREQLEDLQKQYAEYIAQLEKTKLLRSDKDRLILHVARQLGESDANAPAEFVTEVKRYIKKWQSTGRLRRAIARLQANDYATVIVQALKQHNLPAQFLYLPLQESNFRSEAVGPQTRYGHAKGMWQFIPQTASRYGLSIGPQVEQAVFDAADERHDFVKSTQAAARYLRDIYRTDAQASGLLVMAAYNWGEGNIKRLLEQMPANPRQRNFWQLLKYYKIPQQTYDYVFYIVAAAVIGENPRLFGFDFDNPLAGLE